MLTPNCGYLAESIGIESIAWQLDARFVRTSSEREKINIRIREKSGFAEMETVEVGALIVMLMANYGDLWKRFDDYGKLD